MFKKIIAGGHTRKTRLHDQLDNRVPVSRLVRNAAPAVATGIGRLVFGRRPARPWISYDAQRLIGARLTKQHQMLEFGSGMSTVWYARRAGQVVSVEDYRPWFDQVGGILRTADVTNVEYVFTDDRDAYARIGNGRGGFDLIMIDGSVRDACAEHSLSLLKPGGMVYLDNSDMGVDVTTGDVPRARRLVLELTKRGGVPTFFTDFAPTQLFAQQGLLVIMPD